MVRNLQRAAVGLLAALSTTLALPWGADGHETVGALADRLIAGTPAQARVRALLGGLTLEQAAVWGDCVKAVDLSRVPAYAASGRYPECTIFETPAGIAGMVDFVRRNHSNCPRASGGPACHTQYHYTDVPLQRQRYRLGDAGTRDFDVVAAITAAIHVLQGRPAPPPFHIRDQREALLLLVHFTGDIAQPLHVGAAWLGPCGELVDPGAHAADPTADTQGGTRIATIRVATNHRSESLHATWDDIPATLHADRIDADWLALARAEPAPTGDLDTWSAQWADDSLAQARRIFEGLGIGAHRCSGWSVPLTGRDDDAMAPVKKRQLTLAGARLARTLMAIWP